MKNLILAVILSFTLCSSAQAMIIDTTVTNVAVQDYGYSWFSMSGINGGDYSGQTTGYAYEFNLDNSYIISDMEGWIKPYNTDFPGTYEGNLMAVLYGGSSYGSSVGVVPKTGNQLFSQMFTLSHSPSYDGDESVYNWEGVHDLDLELRPGVYWLAFEESYGQRAPNSELSGMRLQGQVVPEPSTMLLFGAGLLGAFVRRRKRF